MLSCTDPAPTPASPRLTPRSLPLWAGYCCIPLVGFPSDKPDITLSSAALVEENLRSAVLVRSWSWIWVTRWVTRHQRRCSISIFSVTRADNLINLWSCKWHNNCLKLKTMGHDSSVALPPTERIPSQTYFHLPVSWDSATVNNNGEVTFTNSKNLYVAALGAMWNIIYL